MSELSPGLEFVWHFAAHDALQRKHEFISPADLFLGVCLLHEPKDLQLPPEINIAIRPESTAVKGLVTKYHLDAQAVFRQLREQLGQGTSDPNRPQISRSSASKACFARAAELAAGQPQITSLHMLAALLE